MNRIKLQKILKSLSPQKLDFSAFDSAANSLKEKLTEQIQVKTLEDVNVALEKNRKRVNFEPLTQAFEQLKTDWATGNEQLIKTLNEKQVQLNEALTQSKDLANLGDESLKQEIEALNVEIAILQARKIEIPDFGKQIKDTETKLMAMLDTAKTLDALQDEKEREAIQIQFATFDTEFKKLKREFQNRGGGSMNRQIFISGVDPLTRYTDINLKPGAGTTITYQNNDTTKKVDITITGGGSGSGITRSIATTTVSSTVGAAAITDYVVLANGGVQITLPTAVSNTNLYTVKNVGSSSVLVATTGGQTIDGSTTLIMPVQFTSVDLISDNSNWEIT